LIAVHHLGRRALAAAASVLLSGGCAIGGADAGGAEEDKTPAALARAVEAARVEVELAEAQLALKLRPTQVAEAVRALRQAERERQGFESGRDLERRTAEQELTEARNALAETEQELAQLELMYAEQDLADKTRELVIGRTQRRLELSRAACALNEEKLARLTTVDHPQKSAQLGEEIEAAEAELEAANLLQRSERVEAELAVLKARHALLDAEEALSKSREAMPDAHGGAGTGSR
jgi:hypothetical protein